MTVKITITDYAKGVPLSSLSLGDYFRFPGSEEGVVYMVLPLSYDPSMPMVRHKNLVTGSIYTREFGRVHCQVHRLKLVSAEFELEGTS